LRSGEPTGMAEARGSKPIQSMVWLGWLLTWVSWRMRRLTGGGVFWGGGGGAPGAVAGDFSVGAGGGAADWEEETDIFWYPGAPGVLKSGLKVKPTRPSSPDMPR